MCWPRPILTFIQEASEEKKFDRIFFNTGIGKLMK